jgi:hypothetical protein
MTNVAELPDAQRAALHALRLRGLAPVEDEASVTALCERGYATLKGTFAAITPEGRADATAWARLEPGSDAEAAVRRGYEQFKQLNGQFLKISTDWQLRSGNVPNDHTDREYDFKVVDRLVALHERAVPLVRRIGEAVPRFSGYPARLTTAVERVEDGQAEWFLSPRVDSYHTVWMLIHEDLFLALGLDRATEEQAG